MENAPAEIITMDPADLEVANAYLQCGDALEVAETLGLATVEVTQILARKHVKSYLDHVYLEAGFNNRVKMRNALDAIIAKKFEDLDAADMGSTKDIMDILQMSHKMKMDELDRMIKLKALENTSVKNQTNIQINSGGENYNNLLTRLMNADAKDI